MNDTYKLQLRHGAESRNFSTRDEVIAYINGKLQYGGVSLLPYEPILFFYGADDAKNAIIMVGLPEGKTQEGKSYFLVDTADLKEQIESLDARYEEMLQALKDEDKKIWDAVEQESQDRIAADEAEAIAREEKDTELETAIADETETRINKDKELKDAIDFTKADLMSVIEACGFVYNEKLAEGRVSYTPDTHDEVIRDAKNVTEAIDKISKFAIKLGQDIKLSVANTDTVNLTIEENGKDGGNTLTAEVNIAGTEGLSKKNYDNNIIGKTAEGLYASVSVEPSVSNPNILVFTTSGYIDGQFKVDAFETEVPLTVYKGDNGKNTGITVTVDTDKNIISGELNLASDETNILKLEDGEYIVEGTAKNIKYKNTTVLNALNSQSARLDEIEDSIALVKAVDIKGAETDTANVIVEKSVKGDFTVSSNVRLSNDKSIIISDGGLKANISATFKKGTSTLLIEVGNNEYAVDLSDLAVSVLKKAEYDTETEELVLEFIVGDTTKIVRIPVGSLIHDIEVDDTDTIDMTLRSVSGGPNHISAELRVDNTHSDNILTVSSNGAYVSKAFITEAVDAESNERKAADEELKSKIDKVTELANANKEAIVSEASTARAAEKANAKAIADNANAIASEVTRATAAETKNAEAIASEINRATEKEGDLLEKIDDNTIIINENKTAIAAEVERSTKADAELKSSVDANASAIDKESDRAKTAENELAAKVTKNTEDIASTNELAINVDKALETEVIRAKAAEEANATAIQTETNRATHAEEDLLEKINKNISDILTVSTEIGNIELRKEGDLSYALYVSGTKHGEFTIPQDQFLKEVTYDTTTKELAFVFITSAGEVTRRISVSDLVDAYVAGEGLTLNGNVFSVNFDKVASVEKVNDVLTKLATTQNDLKTVSDKVDSNTTVCTNLNYSLNNEINRAKAAEQVLTDELSDEISRATNAELDLRNSVASNKTEIDTNKTAINAEQLRATTAEAGINNLITEVSGNITNTKEILAASIKEESDRAKEAERVINEKINEQKNYTSDVNTKLDNSIVEQNEKLQNAKDDLMVEINKKANTVDIYNKEEILERLAVYAKTSDVQSKLDEKLNATEAQNIYATKEALQEVKDNYATNEKVEELNSQVTARLDKDEESIDNFNLTYNEATSELAYTDKNGTVHTYKLYSGSLIKKGEFDSVSNSIVLTIENAGIESQITIPVSELLSDLSDNITANANNIQKINEAISKLAKDWEVKNSTSIELSKTTVGEKDTLTATVRVASSNKQAIQATGDGLYVSNDLEDYTCVFGAEGTISAQNAISKMLEKSQSMENEFNNRITNNANEISQLKEQVKTNTTDIATLKTDAQTNKIEVSNLKTQVTNNTNDIDALERQFTTLDNKIDTFETRLTSAEGNIANLTIRVAKTESDITDIKGQLSAQDAKFVELNSKIESLTALVQDLVGGDVAGLLSEIEKIKRVTGYETYTNTKNMSVRLDKIEENTSDDVVTEINNIKNGMIGPKDGSVEGSIWYELNNIIDAGTF